MGMVVAVVVDMVVAVVVVMAVAVIVVMAVVVAVIVVVAVGTLDISVVTELSAAVVLIVVVVATASEVSDEDVLVGVGLVDVTGAALVAGGWDWGGSATDVGAPKALPKQARNRHKSVKKFIRAAITE